MLLPTKPTVDYVYNREVKCCVCKSFVTENYYWPGADAGESIGPGNDMWCENCYNSWLKRYENGGLNNG